MITTIVLTVVVTLAAVLFAYQLHIYLNPKDTQMITQDEQAILDVVKGLVARVENVDATVAAANQAAADAEAKAQAAEAALAAEQADRAEFTSTLQTTITSAA